MSKCSECNCEEFEVFFGDEGRYKGIQYKRCIKCNKVYSIKKEENTNDSKSKI